MKDNKIEIAGKGTIDEWEKLKEKLDPNDDNNWELAFDFFDKRITTRYLKPINRILNMRLNSGEGFAVVNLQCSLIETIESFYNGWIYNYPNFCKKNEIAKCPWNERVKLLNKHIFVSFFKLRDPFMDYNIDGEDFFYNVRCGLLHETQTKKGWIIKSRHLNPVIFYEENGDIKILYRYNFQKAIEDVINSYKISIKHGEQYGEIPAADLRENFIAKFDHICKLSKPE